MPRCAVPSPIRRRPIVAAHETAIPDARRSRRARAPGLTVALRQHGFAPGARVLVIGASGGVGHLAVQVASARGAGLVVGVCSGRNVEFVQSLGADDVLDYEALKPPDDDETGVRPDPLVERLREVLSAHGGRPFDLVLDTVSSHDARDRAHAYKSRSDPIGRCSTTDRTPPTSTTT